MSREPGYERIATAIADALDSGLYEVELTRDGLRLRQDGVPTEDPILRLARVLDKAGLIDWAAFEEPDTSALEAMTLVEALRWARSELAQECRVANPTKCAALRALIRGCVS